MVKEARPVAHWFFNNEFFLGSEVCPALFIHSEINESQGPNYITPSYTGFLLNSEMLFVCFINEFCACFWVCGMTGDTYVTASSNPFVQIFDIYILFFLETNHNCIIIHNRRFPWLDHAGPPQRRMVLVHHVKTRIHQNHEIITAFYPLKYWPSWDPCPLTLMKSREAWTQPATMCPHPQ